MKEKTTAFVTLGCIFSLFFYYKIYSPQNETVVQVELDKSAEQVVQELVEKINESSESTIVSDSLEPETLKDVECALEQLETDKMTFSESFKYYRECNGEGSLFSWNGNKYSTLLASEKTPTQNQEPDKSKKIADKHHLALQQEVLGATIGTK